MIYHSESGAGRPLILIHGFCETGEIWRTFAEKLSERYRVILPDLPGFGKSVLPEGVFVIEDIASAMVDWLKPWRNDGPVIIGHSLGGYVTLSMAGLDPGPLAGIGLFHSTALADSGEKIENRNKAITFVERHGVEAYTDSFVPGLFYQKDHPRIPEVKWMASQTSPRALTGYLAAMRDRPSFLPVLKSFSKPILWIAGQRDTLIPEEQLRQQAGMALHAVFSSIPETGHMGMLEAEGLTSKAVGDFMAFSRLSAG